MTTYIQRHSPNAFQSFRGPIRTTPVLRCTPSPFSKAFTKGRRLTELSQGLWSDVLTHGDVVIDATCGNGYDTIYLARLLGPSGKIYAYDIQDDAIQYTKHRMEVEIGYEFTPDIPSSDSAHMYNGSANGMPDVMLLRRSHEEMEMLVDPGVSLVCFNLGYRPFGDKEKTTTVASTIAAVEAAMRLLKPEGLISIIAYPGHPEGQRECDKLLQVCSLLPREMWKVIQLSIPNRQNPPILFTLFKRL